MSRNSTTKKQNSNHNGTPVLRFIPLADIEPAPQNTRRKITRVSLKELTASIRQQGVLQPILVREIAPANGTPKFQIVAGERRWRAAQAAGLTEIPATVKPLNEAEALSAQLVENLQREDVHPLDEADGFLRLQTEMQLSLRDIAAQVGKDVRYVARRLALTNLIAEAQQDFRQERITLGHALEICRLAPDIQPYALAACYETNYVANTTEGDDEEAIDKTRPARPVQHLVEWLARHVHLNLTHAPFALDDVRLREDGLTCLQCPNRTGYNQTLFADIQERDTCLHPLCYQAKCQALVQIRQAEIAAKRKTTAVLISVFYGRQAESKGALGRDEYQVLARKADRCAAAEPAVFCDGQQIGQEQWICRDETCKDHRGRVPAYASPATNHGSRSPVQHHERRQELFDVKVDEAVRRQVMREALQTFAWPLARAAWNDIGQEFFRRIPTEHQRTISTVLGWKPEEGSRYQYDEAALREKIAAFSEDELAQFLMLCSFAHYGANREMSRRVDQSEVIALSQTCGVNHALIDAAVRVEFSPKKYKAAHQAYLTAVQDGKPMRKPVVYERTPQEEAALPQADNAGSDVPPRRSRNKAA